MSSTTEEGKASFAIGTAERDQGLRPGNVVALGEEALGDLDAVPAASSRQEATDPAHAALIASASSGDIAALTETYFDGRNGDW